MNFRDKYISTSQNTRVPDATKDQISNEAYAVGELLEEIKRILERVRFK